MNACTAVLRTVAEEGDVRRCFPLIAQLRPHLVSEAEFVARWRRQTASGYRLVAIFEERQAIALAGFRVQENLVHGRFLYVDDLVTDNARRSGGYGERLMQHMREQAHELGCSKLVLDTPLSNALGHRFYFRCGLLATALRFTTAIQT